VGKWWLDIDTPYGSHQMCFLACDTTVLVPDSIAVNLAMELYTLCSVFILMTVSITIGLNEESIVVDDSLDSLAVCVSTGIYVALSVIKKYSKKVERSYRYLLWFQTIHQSTTVVRIATLLLLKLLLQKKQFHQVFF
jgi:hypothetical protein